MFGAIIVCLKLDSAIKTIDAKQLRNAVTFFLILLTNASPDFI